MKKSLKCRFALVGTDSLRGKEMKNVLERKKDILKTLEFYDPEVKEEFSKLTDFGDEPKVIHALNPKILEGMDVVFLAADEATSRKYGRLADGSNYKAVDLTETFNADPDVPLVVPGVNDAVLSAGKANLAANPNPASIFLARLFHVLGGAFAVRQAVAFVMRPASALEEAGVQELMDQSCALLSGSSVKKKIFPDQVAFNILSRIGKTDSDGFSAEEKRILAETRRVLGSKDFPLSLSVVQAPVFHTYSIMVHMDLAGDPALAGLESLFRDSETFALAGEEEAGQASASSVAGKDKIVIGHIKKEPGLSGKFWIWMAADNLTVGSALNAFGISRILCSSDPARA